MNDDEIINLFLKRDENGIIELSTKYHPYCYKIAWNLLANREDAEECLNDTWFSVWSQILEEIGLERAGAPGTTAALAMLNDQVTFKEKVCRQAPRCSYGRCYG